MRDRAGGVTPARVRWTIISLLLAATTINYIDRQAIAVAAPIISKEFGLSATDYSFIVSAFLLAYAVMQVVAGVVIDRVGTRRGFSLAITGWSLATMLHAFTGGLWGLAASRFALGAFEAANFPAALKAVSEWCTAGQRAAAVGVLSVGPGLGAVLAQPIVAGLILTVGWRGSFVVVGAIGFLWLLVWQRVYFAPGNHPWLAPDDRRSVDAAIAAEQIAGSDAPVSLRVLLADGALWGVMASRFVVDGAFYFFVFWLPKYLTDERGFTLVQIALLAWIPYLAADAGALTGGALGSALTRRGWSLAATRFTVLWTGALIVPLSLPVLSPGSPLWALFFISLAMFGMQMRVAAHFTLPADLYPPRSVALAWGLTGAAGSLGGMAFTPFVGWAVDNWSYVPVFWMVVVTNLAAPLILQLTVATRLRRIGA